MISRLGDADRVAFLVAYPISSKFNRLAGDRFAFHVIMNSGHCTLPLS